ncbi:MAG: sugar ABC transporter permease [Lachnospiraceae bacterium]|nr:sugar ABC transporter permease [Lachnospiraceae bacterium]
MKTKGRKYWSDLRWFLLFSLPGVIYIIFFVAYPIFYNVIMSFQDVTASTLLKTDKEFVGLLNYTTIFSNPKIVGSIVNTLIFTVASIGFQFVIGFLLALLFSNKFPLNKLYRALVMIGWMVPMLVVATIGKWFFTGDASSLVNYFLMKLGFIEEPIMWLVNTNTAMFAMICVNIWKGIPFNMLLMTTALTTMPEDIYEAAAIDGATRIQRFFRITVPLLKPTILAVITQGFILTFKAFELIYVMTKGGPADTTHIMATYSYSLTFDQFQFSQGAAIANVMFAILLVFSLFYVKLISKDEVIG